MTLHIVTRYDSSCTNSKLCGGELRSIGNDSEQDDGINLPV